QDIIYELKEQLDPLVVQKKAAQEFLHLKEKLSKVDVAYTVAEMREAKQVWEKTSTTWNTLDAKGRELTELITKEERSVQSKRKRRSELDTLLEEGNQNHLRVVEALKQAEGQQEVLLERSKHTQKSSQEYQEILTEIDTKLDQFETEKSQLISQLSQKNGETQEIEKKQVNVAKELQKYQKTAKELMEELRSHYVDKL